MTSETEIVKKLVAPLGELLRKYYKEMYPQPTTSQQEARGE